MGDVWPLLLEDFMESVDGVQELRLIRENTKELSHASNVPELAQKVDEAILQRKVEGIASLASCVAKQDVARIRTMIENAFVDKDEADYDGRTALHFAASAGHQRCHSVPVNDPAWNVSA